MPANHDLNANAGPSKPFRSPTSGRTSTKVGCKDQPDDQQQQGKREREDQIRGQRKRKAPFRASRSPDWEQEQGYDTGSAIHCKSEGLPEIFSLILEFCQPPLQKAESSTETNKRMQRVAKLLGHYSHQDKINASLRKAHLQEAEKHGNASFECTALRRALRYKNREIIISNERTTSLSARNERLVRKNKRLSSAYTKLYGSYLAQDWCIKKSQITINAKDEQIERFKSSALEKDEEIRQRGRCVEELEKTIQETNNLIQKVLKVNKQQQETNASSTRMIREMLELGKNQQKTNTALTKLLREMDARIREQDKYVCYSYEPTRTSDSSLPVSPGLDFSAPPAFSATNQQQIPVQTSSSNMVNFEPSYSESFAYRVFSPSTPTCSPRSQVSRGNSLQAPFRSEYQDGSWPGSSRY